MHLRAAILRKPASQKFQASNINLRRYGCAPEPNPTRAFFDHVKNGYPGYALACVERAIERGFPKEEMRKAIEKRGESLVKELGILNLALSRLGTLEQPSEETQKDLNSKTNRGQRAIPDEVDDLLISFTTIVNSVGDK